MNSLVFTDPQSWLDDDLIAYYKGDPDFHGKTDQEVADWLYESEQDYIADLFNDADTLAYYLNEHLWHINTLDFDPENIAKMKSSRNGLLNLWD